MGYPEFIPILDGMLGLNLYPFGVWGPGLCAPSCSRHSKDDEEFSPSFETTWLTLVEVVCVPRRFAIISTNGILEIFVQEKALRNNDSYALSLSVASTLAKTLLFSLIRLIASSGSFPKLLNVFTWFFERRCLARTPCVRNPRLQSLQTKDRALEELVDNNICPMELEAVLKVCPLDEGFRFTDVEVVWSSKHVCVN